MNVDREALLVALVLAPATYSRNRFFELYTDPEVRRVRRRASLIRSIVRHVAQASPAELGEVLAVEPAAADHVALTYAVPALGLRRTVDLQPLELALVRFAIARGRGEVPPGDQDRARIETALLRLAPPLPLGIASGAEPT